MGLKVRLFIFFFFKARPQPHTTCAHQKCPSSAEQHQIEQNEDCASHQSNSTKGEVQGQPYPGPTSCLVGCGLKGIMFYFSPGGGVMLLRLGWMWVWGCSWGGRLVGVVFGDQAGERVSEPGTGNKRLHTSRPCCKMSSLWEMGPYWLTCKLWDHMLPWFWALFIFFLQNEGYCSLYSTPSQPPAPEAFLSLAPALKTWRKKERQRLMFLSPVVHTTGHLQLHFTRVAN